MKKEIKPKELKRVANKPAGGEVKKSLPIGQYQQRVVNDAKEVAASNGEDVAQTIDRYARFYKQNMDIASALDGNDPQQKAAAKKALMKQNPNIFAPDILYDVPSAQLKREAKGISKKLAKQLKKSGGK